MPMTRCEGHARGSLHTRESVGTVVCLRPLLILLPAREHPLDDFGLLLFDAVGVSSGVIEAVEKA